MLEAHKKEKLRKQNRIQDCYMDKKQRQAAVPKLPPVAYMIKTISSPKPMHQEPQHLHPEE
jgi:hypothetical protein